MRLVRYAGPSAARTGVWTSAGIVDAHEALPGLGDVAAPGDLVALANAGTSLRERLANAVSRRPAVAPDGLRLLPPVGSPPKIICAWVNYREEGAAPASKTPIFFGKFSNALIGHQEAIRLPRITSKVIVEPELAVVMGTGGYRIPAAEVSAHVAGYTIGNDVTSFNHRLVDLLGTRGPNMMAKTFDTFAPMGPCLVTTDEVPDPQALRVREWINDSLEVDSSTSQMLTSVPDFISYLSEFVTLAPGDVIFTSSPRPLRGPRYLSPGDQVRIEIERIGMLANPVVAEAQ
ncbi:MAG TPA: fumarylacetoacetate hydrolase family protein [Steroidobacteraceae bacterium]|nr:fumarylacetoacetate hydrolase family protein [Steroidobacteraceae bacterium]